MNYYCTFYFHATGGFMCLRNDKIQNTTDEIQNIVKMRIVILKMLNDIMVLHKNY